ncbi:MAG: MBL fold metallo-hydrolase [Myxococcales bacterium]|nr:MBL fold metallo-hydrolase [Myxococcales bacterium]
MLGTTCSMITLRSGHRWLIDCGRQAPDQLHDAGYCWHDIEGQIITHVHGDHVFGLEDFAFVRFFESKNGVLSTREGGRGPKLIAHGAVIEEIWQTLAPSLRYLRDDDGNRLEGTLGHYFDVLPPVHFEPPKHNPWRHAEWFVAEGLTVIARESEHVPGKPSCSLEIDVFDEPDDDRIAWWSGDCTVDAEFLKEIEPRTTIFFHDCTFVDYPGQVHGFFALLAALPERVRKKMVLMHHEDDIEQHRAQMEAADFRIALPGHAFDLETGQRIA